MCNPLKLYGDVGLCNGFHAVNSGSNPLGDAKFRYKEECQSPKDLGILCFFIPIRFPEIQPRPLASMKFVGISVGRNVVRHFRYLHG